MTDNDKLPQANDKIDSDLTIGERIQKKRKELDLSVDELVSLLASYDDFNKAENEKGISSPTLYRYEKGEREPATREIRLLCHALNVSADWLVFGKLWNGTQEVDSNLANQLRSLVNQAVNKETINDMFNMMKLRDKEHLEKLNRIKYPS